MLDVPLSSLTHLPLLSSHSVLWTLFNFILTILSFFNLTFYLLTLIENLVCPLKTLTLVRKFVTFKSLVSTGEGKLLDLYCLLVNIISTEAHEISLHHLFIPRAAV